MFLIVSNISSEMQLLILAIHIHKYIPLSMEQTRCCIQISNYIKLDHFHKKKKKTKHINRLLNLSTSFVSPIRNRN